MHTSDRKNRWISYLDAHYRAELLALQDAMRDFYTRFHTYYFEIDFSADTWDDHTQLEAQDILAEASQHIALLEVGCGKANILESGVINPHHYTGIDIPLR